MVLTGVNSSSMHPANNVRASIAFSLTKILSAD
jgi:hypothetical protein